MENSKKSPRTHHGLTTYRPARIQPSQCSTTSTTDFSSKHPYRAHTRTGSWKTPKPVVSVVKVLSCWIRVPKSVVSPWVVRGARASWQTRQATPAPSFNARKGAACNSLTRARWEHAERMAESETGYNASRIRGHQATGLHAELTACSVCPLRGGE